MLGLIFSIMAGLLVALQSVFNTSVTDKIGFWETNTFVHGTGFLFTFIIMMLFGNGTFKRIGEVNKLYLLGGIFGALIVFCVTKSISLAGATMTVSVMLIAQLIMSTCIDSLGLFGMEKIEFHFTRILGVLVMIAGVVIFKWKG